MLFLPYNWIEVLQSILALDIVSILIESWTFSKSLFVVLSKNSFLICVSMGCLVPFSLSLLAMNRSDAQRKTTSTAVDTIPNLKK